MAVLELLQGNAFLFYLVVGFLGLMVGSFLNVVIHRLPIMMENAWAESLAEAQAEAAGAGGDNASLDAIDPANPAIASEGSFNLVVPRSRCPNCQTLISWWQNIPVLSYLMLKGKCHNCSNHISARYPIIEGFTMLLSLIVAWQLGPTPQAALGIVVTWFLVAMSAIDFDTQLLPDVLTLPLMWIGLLASLVPVFVDVRTAVVGAAVGYMILWSIYQLFKLITGKEGMGYGDFKLLAAIGALLGWQALPMVILLSSLVGAVVGITLIVVRGRDRNIPIPFGPYLAAAGWLAMLFGDQISRWYTTL